MTYDGRIYGVKGIIRNPSLGKYLFIQRDDKPQITNPGKWDLVGGEIESGETADTALLREAREELGESLVLVRLKKIGGHSLGPEHAPAHKSLPLELEVWYAETETPLEALHVIEGQRAGYFSFEELGNLDLVPLIKESLSDYSHLLKRIASTQLF
ncbi:NUDIX domain-containing protein [Candidatus Pacearchaeota archaeon]|nr:NUDIX domain-containing protein [Candidatus Pacearchaeota archaeon]